MEKKLKKMKKTKKMEKKLEKNEKTIIKKIKMDYREVHTRNLWKREGA